MFHTYQDVIMGRASTYTLLEDIFSYSINVRVGKQIQLKDIPSKTGGPSKEKEIIEEKKEAVTP